jgi:hypothetical protein
LSDQRADYRDPFSIDPPEFPEAAYRRSYSCVTMQVDASPRFSDLNVPQEISKEYCLGYRD